MSDGDKNSSLLRTAYRGGKGFTALTPGIQTLVPKRSCSLFLSVQLRLWLTKYPPRIKKNFLLKVNQAICMLLRAKFIRTKLFEQKLHQKLKPKLETKLVT